MGRKKLEMVLIKDKKTRTRTFINRKKGILKKANELSKLCDVDVGVIIYKPNAGNPYVWPQESDKLNNILGRYRTTSIEDRQKRATNVCSIPKTDHIDSLSADQLMELIGRLDYKLGIVNERIDTIKRNEQISTMMSMLGMMPNNFQYMGDYQSQSYVEEQQNADRISMPGSSSSTNFDNGYMGYDSGLMGVHGCFENYNFGKNIIEDVNGDGGSMWNPTPFSWYCGPPEVNQYQYHLQQNYNQQQFY